jgi:hypothetical protein
MSKDKISNWETTALIFEHIFPGDRDALWRFADFETNFSRF